VSRKPDAVHLIPVLLLADGGDHEPLAGIAVFYLVKKALHGFIENLRRPAPA
jgi:hypothetical protein